MPHGLHVPGARQLHAPESEPGHAIDLLDRGVDVAIGQAGEPDVAVAVVTAEGREPVVVDPEHLVGRLVVVESRGRAEDAEDHLGIDAVTVHVLHAEGGVRRPADASLAVLVEARRRHDVDTIVLPRHVLLPRRPHAADEPERSAILAGPVRPVRPLADEGHAVPHRRGGVRGEKVRRQHGKVDVAVGGDPCVAHVTPSVARASEPGGRSPRPTGPD